MKNTILTFLNQPRIVVPITALIALVIGGVLYPWVGRAPQVSLASTTSSATTTIAANTNLDLAFPKAGRIQSVEIKVGDHVEAGQILARLSAPEAEGLINQTKGALSLAQAQYHSLSLDYVNTKNQQDLLVNNAYQNLLKTPLQAVAKDEPTDRQTLLYPLPTISGNYLLGKEGSITIKTYAAQQGLWFNATGLVEDTKMITQSPVPLGNSGLSILFPSPLAPNLTWTITIPNTQNPNYAINKNAYDLAVANRQKVLSELEQNLNSTGSDDSVAKAQIAAAEGAYQAALGAYQSNLIVAPAAGIIKFVDPNLTVGQTVLAGKTVISLTTK